MELWESFEDFSDSDTFESPAIFDRNSQMKKKFKLSVANVAADNFGRTEADLKQSDKCDVCFKSVPEITSSENVLAFQNRKFSEHTSHSSMSSFNADIPLNLAIDGVY